MSKEGWTTPSGETWEKKSTNDGKEIGIKTSTDSSSGGFEGLVGGGNRKVLPFAFIAIKGEPVTLEFAFKN